MNVGYLPDPTNIYQLKLRHSNANIKVGNFNYSKNETNDTYENSSDKVSINIMHHFNCQTTMKMNIKEHNTNKQDAYSYVYFLFCVTGNLAIVYFFCWIKI